MTELGDARPIRLKAKRRELHAYRYLAKGDVVPYGN
jgi:hypothetical protein